MRKILYITLLFLGFGAFAQTPIIDYSFEGSAKDNLGNFDGILVNGGVYQANRFGDASSAIELDGSSQYINIDNGGAPIVSTGKITFEGWFNTFNFSAGPNLLSTPELIVYINSSGFPGMALQDGSSSAPFVSSVAVNNNEWFHLAATYDGSTARIYLNGVQTGSLDISVVLSTTTSTTHIGANNGGSNTFPGLMDEVSFYDFGLTASEVFELYQEGAFITTWETTTDGEKITIPTFSGETYDYTVDWGDGTVEHGFTEDAIHVYVTAGTYSVSIIGQFPRIYFNGGAEGQEASKIQSIEHWGDLGWSSMEGAFNGCSSLLNNAADAPDLTSVTSVRNMFNGCYSFSGDLSNWDVSNVQIFWDMFINTNFNSDISGWNTSAATNLQGMFANNGSFNQSIGSWNVSNVVNMHATFQNASSFNQDLSEWDVSSLEEASYTFWNASSFNSDLSGWNVSSIISTQNMFADASSFDQNLEAWDIGNVLNMESMFDNSGMSVGNYDATLEGWSTVDAGAGETQIPTNITLGASGLSYCTGESARTDLITNSTWTISGDVMDCPDLLAQYLFNGDASDNSEYGNDGTVFEAELAPDRFGNANSAYSFDGDNDYISIPVQGSALGSAFTISAWVSHTKNGEGSGIQGIISSAVDNTDGGVALGIESPVNDRLKGVFNNTISEFHTVHNTTNGLVDREWVFVTYTYDGTVQNLYENGELVASFAGSGVTAGNGNFIIGANLFYNGGPEGFYGGLIDDITIYNRTLDITEIQLEYAVDEWINPRIPLAALYSSLGGDNWATNTNWNTEESLADWHGVVMDNGLVTGLDLKTNNVEGSLPVEIGNLTNLKTLDFFNNPSLSGSIPPEIGNLSNLTRLGFQACNLTGTIPSELGNLTNLTYLVLGPNQLTGAVPSTLSNLTNVTIFAIHENQLTSLPDLTGMAATSFFYVQNNQFGFSDLIVNQAFSSSANPNFSPQTIDEEEILIVSEAEEVTLTTTEDTPNTNYQWYFNGEIIDGAVSKDHIFTYNASLEGEYFVEMTNDDFVDVIISRASYIVRDEINTAPTDVTLAGGLYMGVLKEGVPIGTLAAVLETIDADPIDTYTYTFATGPGDGFNSSYTISNDSVFTAIEMDPIAAPVHQFRVRSTDSGGEFAENTFIIQVSPIQVCNNDVLTATSGTFNDGSGTFNYEDNFSCNWLIELSPENQVRLEFSAFDTEESFDFLRVYDGNDATGTLLAEISGTTIPEPIISSGNTMFVTFESDGGVNAEGFTALYSQVTPVADYPFTDGSTDDFSGYGNNVITNKAFVSTDRLGGGAYYFDGSTGFMQASSTLSGSDVPFTVSTWIRWDGNNADFTEIVSWWNTSSTAKIYLGTTAGSNELRFGDSWGSTGAFIPANEWVHIAATYDGSKGKIYINGTLSAESSAGISQDFGGGDLYIGRQGTNDSEYFDGIIDEIKIYDISLSANEINNLYSATSTDLIAYFPFSNGLDDASNNGFDASDLGSGNLFTSDRLGVGSNAYDFDIANGSALEISSFSNYNFGDEITVMGWIRPDTYPANDIQLFNNSFLSGSGYEFRLVKEDLSDDSKRKLFAGVTGISFGNYNETTISVDEWTHVAFKFSRGQGTTLYINGENLITYGFVEGTDDLPIPVSSDGILIGEGFDGEMDEIKIFNSALSDQEILNEYNENLWPFHSLAFRGPEASGENTIDQNLALNPNGSNSFLGVLQLYFDGDYQFRASAADFEAFMGDNELNGIAEPGATQLNLTEGFYAIGFRQSNFEYFVEPISSVGIIGSALTGDNSGWDSDIDLTDLGNGIFQITNLSLFDGEFKLRINNDWSFIDWGSNNLDGSLNYLGNNIPITAGNYTLSFDLLNNKYSIIDVSSSVAVAKLDFSGNLTDESGFGNNGSSSSAAYTTGRFGSENAAIVLDGTSNVNLGDDASINLASGFTMNIWINPTDNDNAGGIFQSGASFHQHIGATSFNWRYFQNGVENFIDEVPIEAPTGTWTMITWTYDGGVMSFYDDGVLVHEEIVFGDLDINANSYLIGSAFNGSIDAFQWVNGVLSAKEIQYLYSEGIILDYALDGTTDDQSGNNIHGSLPNGGTYVEDRFGTSASALSLDGATQYLLVDNADEPLPTGNEITFEGWFNVTDFSSGPFLLSTPGFIAFVNDSGLPTIAPQSDVSTLISSSVSINLNEWFHFAGTYDGSTIKVYVNGVETASSQLDVTLNRNISSTEIGGNGSTNFPGIIDDVTIYNYALNLEEIGELYAENDFASPLISQVFPTSGAPGTSIRVYGKNFSQAGTVISFGGTDVSPTSIADNVLYFEVPDMASGYHALNVVNDFDASLAQAFTILNTNESSVSFGASSSITTGVNTPVELHTTDLNGDGYPDLLAASFLEGNLTTYLNNADGTFTLPTTIFTSSNSGSNGLSTIRSGDLDNDGDVDIVFSYLNNLYWFENDGTGTFISSSLFSQLPSTSFNYRDIQIGDINGDALLDIVATNNDGGTIDWFSNDGNGSFTNEGIISSSPASFKLSLNDMDNDGDLDIAQANATNFILINDGLGGFTRTDLTSPAANGYNAVITADLNNDDLIDMVAGSEINNNLDVYLNGNSDPTNIHQTGGGTSPRDFSIGDIDGDGDIDIVTAFDRNLTIYLNDGESGFTLQVIDSDIANLTRVIASDIDNDGDLDIFTSRQSGEIAWFENQIPSDRKEILSYDLSLGATPSETDYSYIGEFEGSRYYISVEAQTWTDAKIAAEALGGHLATIHSLEENEFIAAAVGAVWVGGTDQEIEGQFEWVDGTPFDFTNWAETEPNNSGEEHYLEFGADGFWNDLNNTERQFVVEIPSYEGIIDPANNSIAVEVPFGTDLSSLVANFQLSVGAFAESNSTLQESGVTVNDFSSDVDYLITAEDATFKNWIVSVSLDDGLLAAYSFSGNASDDSGNGNSLTSTDAVLSLDRFGNENAAYNFNGGTSQLQRSDTDLLGGEYEVSLVFWANPVLDGGFQDVINFGNIRAFINESDRMKFQLSTLNSSVQYDAEIEEGVWQQYVLTFDKDTARVYRDAVLTDKFEKYGAIDAGGILTVGSDGFSGNYYEGAVDDVLVYNRVLSESEIQTLYNENGWPPLNTETDIVAFSVAGEIENKVINSVDHTVDIEVDFNTDISGMTPSFTLSDGAIAIANSELQESDVSVVDFTNPITYSILAEDNTTSQDWLVTVALDSVQGDSLALVALYNATDGDNWTTSWDLNLPTTEWSGVELDADGRVTNLDLFSNNLIGTIPPEIGNLSRVTFINLTDNQLSGVIPTEIGNLSSSLSTLSLSNNGLTGELPSSLGNLVGLQSLDLSRNEITGTIPSELGNLSLLNDLFIDNNLLSGAIPEALGNLTSLGQLTLQSNDLIGSIPISFGNLTNLTLLSMFDNELSGEIPAEFGNLSLLRVLYLFNNELSGEIPSEFGSMTDLRVADLDQNNLTGNIPSSLGNLAEIVTLNLSSNQLSGSIPEELGNLTKLTTLSLESNQLSGGIPDQFGNLSLLKSLNLSDNQITSIPVLTDLPFDVQGLRVERNKIGFTNIIDNLQLVTDGKGFSYNPQVVQDTIRDLISGEYKVSTNERTENTNYQWFKDDVLIEGATDSTYLASEAGRYHVAMTNTDVGIENLTITRAPFILTGADAADIISFSFDGFESIVNIGDGTIDIEVPFASPSLGSLIAVFELSPGASAEIGGTPQESGVTANDFNNDVTYTITALDGVTTQNWVVSTTIGPNPANDIENFDIANMVGDEVIDLNNHTVSITMPYNTDRSSLTPFIAISTGASIDPLSDVPQDFTSTFSYTVTSESGVAQDWTIDVTNELNNETDIISFVIPNQVVGESIDVDNHTILVQMPFAADVTSLTPIIQLSAGATVNPASGAARDFTNPVVYNVIPEDNSASQAWTVTVEVDASPNNTPSALALDNNSINENTVGLVGSLTTTDADATDSHVYSLINGIGATDNSRFTISGNQLSSLEEFDFETKSSYSILVRTDDQRGGTFDQQFAITVNDVNEAPVISDQLVSIDENFSSPTAGTVSAIDQDAGTTLTFSKTSGSDLFTITANGTIGVVDGDQLDFETTPTFVLTVNVTDGDLSAQAFLTINLNDVNDAPVILSDQTFNIPENSPNGTNLLGGTNPGVVEATDQDNGDALSFSIEDGNGTGGGAFAIDNTGQLSVNDFTQLDFDEGTQVFTLSIRVIDLASAEGLATVTVNVTDVVENVAPSISDQTFSVDENTSNGTSVAIVVASDDDGDDLTFAITSGNESGAIAINSDNGELTVGDASLLDFESGTTSYSLVVEVSDGIESSSATITIDINNINEETSFSLTGNPTSSTKEDFDVTATITDEDAIIGVKLYTKKVTGSSFSASANITVGSDNVYTQTINGAAVMDNIGVEYYFELEDEFGVQRSDTLIVSTVVGSNDVDVSSKVSPGTSVSNYTILAFPFEGVNLLDVFGNLGENKTDWRLLRYATGQNIDNNSGPLTPGVGYWFITKTTNPVINTGGKSVTLDNGVFRINLDPSGGVDGGDGYTLIGNPFQATLNWGDVIQHNIDKGIITSGEVQTSLIGYNGQFGTLSSLSSFEGAFIQSSRSVNNFEIPVSASSNGGRIANSKNVPQDIFIDNSEWELDLFFKTNSYQYSIGGVGISREAKDERDGLDFSILPRLELYLDLLFEDGSTRSIKKSANFKSWSFNVRNNLQEEVIDVTWDVPVSSSKTLILVDGASQKIVDLKVTSSMQMKNNPSATHQLYYGDKKTIFENLDLPFDAYYGSYPNPVEDVLTIEMYGSSQKEVSISMVGLDGKSINMGSMKLYEGLNKEKINLEEYSVPAGVYFLKVNDKVVTKIVKR